jgi:hypothetical protein
MADPTSDAVMIDNDDPSRANDLTLHVEALLRLPLTDATLANRTTDRIDSEEANELPELIDRPLVA